MHKSGILGSNKGRYGQIRANMPKNKGIMVLWGQISVDKTKLEQIIT